MMTKGMKAATKNKEKEEDKPTNILCAKCGEVVGLVAAGYSVVVGTNPTSTKQTCLCRCGNRMVYSITRG